LTDFRRGRESKSGVFRQQLFDDLVVGSHDVFMDKIVTELAVYEGLGQSK
jgi:5-formyltetrahydrofolate cyclo-ligase